MYIDSVVASGLIIIGLCCIIIMVVGVYAYNHIKQDSINADKKQDF